MDKESNIYFVEEVFGNFNETETEISNYSVVLLKVSEDDFPIYIESKNEFIVLKISIEQADLFQEGNFIYYNPHDINDNLNLSNANNSKVAKASRALNNLYRGRLKLNEEITITSNDLTDSNVFSYHINVGHGNCSIIVIKQSDAIRIWMIDCSNFDFISKTSYQKNIDDCIFHIQSKFNISNFRIEKFFLTHSHFDHYSGVITLINRGYINMSTLVFVNLHYSMPNKNQTRLFAELTRISCPIVEPLTTYVTSELEFWHPMQRTIRSMTGTYNGQSVDVQSNANNSSAVFQIKFKDKTMLFTGDLETPRWNTITNCPIALKGTDYFLVSHHGSLNGHLRNNCPYSFRISNVSQCKKYTASAILMGRDQAFSGIYSQRVLTDFGNNLFFSEKDLAGVVKQFLEIEWDNNSKNWF